MRRHSAPQARVICTPRTRLIKAIYHLYITQGNHDARSWQLRQTPVPRMDAEQAPEVLDDGADDDVDGVALLVQARRPRKVEAAPHALHTREQPRDLGGGDVAQVLQHAAASRPCARRYLHGEVLKRREWPVVDEGGVVEEHGDGALHKGAEEVLAVHRLRPRHERKLRARVHLLADILLVADEDALSLGGDFKALVHELAG